ncbi:TetR/AcrR family transcriptional regulator [Marinicauda algicola]|uniref:TetR/AcrR family transcriptional regulator n=1 Tax=Marinicauda algicola TaxID=2029849 RepID=A0A4S2GY27_9PROT|nr:TetR/AcrR family transcriptional regulator [Marinicauda algicola]TGY87781.1 TetR/AcrR family transcriptional regulator [Marinicauda algicola]
MSTDTRTRILDAALEALPETGLAGLSVGKLAAAAGMSKSGLFARFGGQDALQNAIIEAAIDRFRDQVIEPARAQKGARARLETLADRWTDWLLLTRPCPILQAAFEAPGLTPQAAETARQSRRDFTSWVERLARIAVAEGGLAAHTDPASFAFRFEGTGLATQSAGPIQGRDDAATLARAAFSDLFKAHS